jgi:hypothetical protein
VLAPDAATALSAKREHYRDQRRGLDRLLAEPSIASQELGDQPLLLFVPLKRHAHPAVVRRQCPELDPGLQGGVTQAQAGDVHTQALLACLHAWTRPELDGQALSDHELIFSEDSHSGLEGLLWRVPTDAISSGRHVLSLQVPDTARGAEEQGEVEQGQAVKRLHIVFFK